MMKRSYFILVFLVAVFTAKADSLKERLARYPVTPIPFSCTKSTPYPRPTIACPDHVTSKLPLYLYNDLGLIQKNSDPNIECVIFRKFDLKETNFDLVAFDMNVSEWAKQLLVTFKDEKLIDYIEANVSWSSKGIIYIKQWRIDTDQNIIVTWLKINSPTPVSAFSDFGTVNAQRIDLYYKVDANGKFQLTKEVKYKPQPYTQAYLSDKTKNLWEGKETPME